MSKPRSSLNLRLSSIEIWNRELAFYSAMTFSVLAFVMDCVRLNNYSPLWLVINVIGYLTVALPIIVLKKYASRIGLRRFRTPWPNVGLALFLGGLHNWIIALMAIQAEIETTYEPIFRWVGGAAIGFAIVFLAATVFSTLQDHNDRMKQLQETTRRLEKYRMSLKAILDKETERLKLETRNTLLPQLEQLQKRLRTRESKSTVLDDLRKLLATEIRPMNTELARRANSMALLPRVQPDAESKPQLPTTAAVRASFSPLAIFFMMSFQQGMTFYLFFGIIGLALGPAVSLSALGLGFAVKALVPKKLVLPTRWALAAVIGLALVSVSPILLLDYLLMPSGTSFIPTLFTTLMIATLMSGYVAYLTNIQTDLKRIEEELAVRNQQLEVQNSVFDQQLWISRRHWLTVLHGTVQASLTAAISHLNQVEDSKGLEKARADIKRASKALLETQPESIDLVAAFTDLQRTWSGICEITPIPSEEAQQLVLANEQAKICVNELVKEAVSNAIRHGKATQVWVTVEVARPGVIELRVENNGLPPQKDNPHGVGSQLFSDLTLRWSRGFDLKSNRAYTWAQLAIG